MEKSKETDQLLEKSRIQRHHSTLQILLLSLNALLGAVYWGYIQCHYSVTQDIYALKLNIANNKVDSFNGLTTGLIQFGAIFGSFVCSGIVQRMSRIRSLMLVDIVSLIGIGIHCIANQYFLFVGNFICGMGIGMNSNFIGIYISEMSPKEISGMTGSLVQYMLTVGIIIIYIVGLFVPTKQNYIEQGMTNQYYMFIFIFPALFPILRSLFLFLFVKYDTPYYYASIKDYKNLRLSLEQIYKHQYVDEMYHEINDFFKTRTVELTFNQILKDRLIRRKTYIGVGLAVVMQMTGINGILFYSNTLFRNGKDDEQSQKNAQILSLINAIVLLISNFIASYIVDKLGRKTILVWGQIMISVILGLLVMSEYMELRQFEKILIMLFTFIFGVSQGPVIWLYIPEILIGKCVSIASTTVMIFATIIASVTPVAISSPIGVGGYLLIFTVSSFLLFIWQLFYLVETKNKTRQQIDNAFLVSVKS